MARIKRPDTAFNGPIRTNMVNKDYRDFVKLLPCCVTLKFGTEAAHVSTPSPKHGHWGRAKTKKASDRFVLPLIPSEHTRQHNFKGGEMAYWAAVGIDPHGLALALSGYWFEFGDAALDECTMIIRMKAW